jgi:geranylgeranyl pyrophosphate synthase
MKTSATLLANDTQLIAQHAEEIGSHWLKHSSPECASLNTPINKLLYGALETALYEPARAATLTAGKRMRPLLSFWMWRTATDNWAGSEPIPQKTLEIGYATELLHAASLVIDDVQDGSMVRRGEPSVHARFGVPIAINAANWLYFEAMAMLTSSGCNPASVVSMMRTCHIGQALDLSTSLSSVIAATVDAQANEITDYYTQIAHQKTAALMKFGATAVLEQSKHSASFLKAANDLFDLYGLIYQKADDLRNINQSVSGAKANEDLASIRNYVTVTLIQQLSAREKRELIHASQTKDLRSWLLAHPRFGDAVQICAAELQTKLSEASHLAQELCPQAVGIEYLNAVIHAPVTELIRSAHTGAEYRVAHEC